MGKRENDCQYYREQLVKDRERLAELEARGNDAVSAYDLHMGYDAEFNKQLKRNHIIYNLKQLERCPKAMFDVPQAVTEPSTHTAAPKESKPEPIARQVTLFDVHDVM